MSAGRTVLKSNFRRSAVWPADTPPPPYLDGDRTQHSTSTLLTHHYIAHIILSDVHVTVHRDKFLMINQPDTLISYDKPTRHTNYYDKPTRHTNFL